jgi:hypothetical protein
VRVLPRPVPLFDPLPDGGLPLLASDVDHEQNVVPDQPPQRPPTDLGDRLAPLRAIAQAKSSGLLAASVNISLTIAEPKYLGAWSMKMMVSLWRCFDTNNLAGRPGGLHT